jgi:hypothetical protein
MAVLSRNTLCFINQTLDILCGILVFTLVMARMTSAKLGNYNFARCFAWA